LVVKTQGTQAKFRRKSFGKIQSSATCIWRDSPYSLERSQEFRDRNKFSIQNY